MKMKELRKNINLENSSLMQIDRKFEHLCISEKSTILDAMQVIEKGKERLCLVVNKKGVLKRVVSDGDIRRAIIEGHKLTDLALNVHNQEPLVARDTNPEKAFDQLNKWVTLIPVVNIDNKVLGITRFNKKSNNIRQRSVAIVGLGYVGLTLAVILADNGFSVIGLDRNKNLVKNILLVLGFDNVWRKIRDGLRGEKIRIHNKSSNLSHMDKCEINHISHCKGSNRILFIYRDSSSCSNLFLYNLDTDNLYFFFEIFPIFFLNITHQTQNFYLVLSNIKIL